MKRLEPWRRYDLERLQLGAARYAGSVRACIKFLLLFPWIKTGLTNKFAFGTLALQDSLQYRNKGIPEKEVWEIFPGIGHVDVTIGKVFPDEGSTISFREAVVLGGIIRCLKPARVFEIGTSRGVSSYIIASNLPDNGKVFTLDLPPAAEGIPGTRYAVTISDRKMIFADRRERRFLSTEAGKKVVQLHGDSATCDYSEYQGNCDVVFIDGSHSEEYIRSDTETGMRLVRKGGVIIWHDFNDGFFWPAVSRHLNRHARDHRLTRIKGTMFCVTS